MADSNLNIRITADGSQASGELGGIANQIQGLTGLSRGQNIGQGLTQLGQGMVQGGQALFNTALTAGQAVIGTSANFESAMNNVTAVTGATGDAFTSLREQAKELGRTTAFSASESADAMAFLGMAGFETAEILEAMPSTLSLASAGSLDLAKSADIASNILGGFQLEANQMNRVADVLANTARNANTDIIGLGDAFSYAAPVAQSFGMELEEASAIIGALGDIGIQGGRGGTTLAGALSRLLKPVPKAQKALDRLGISTQNAEGDMRSFTSILDDFADSGATAGDILTVFGEESGRGILSLVEGIRAGNVDIAEMTGLLQDSQGVAEDMANTKLQGFNGQVKQLQSAFEGLLIEIGDTGILTDVTGMVGGLTRLVGKISEVNPEILRFGTYFTVAAGAVGGLLIPLGFVAQAIGGLTMLFSGGALTSGMTMLTGAFTKIGAVLAPVAVFFAKVVALVGAFAFAIAGVAANVMVFVQAVQEFGIVNAIIMAAAAVWQTFTQIVGGALSLVAGLINAAVVSITAFGAAVVGAAAMAVAGFIKIVAAIASVMEKVFGLPPVFSQALNQSVSIVTSFAGQMFSAGAGLMRALGDGIKSAVGGVIGSIEGAMSKIRAMLPGSDAKTGPLSDLTYSGSMLPETFAKGILNNAGVIDNAMMQTLPSPMVDSSIPVASNSASTNISSPVTVNITLNNEGGNSADVEQILREKADELANIVVETLNRQNRTRYVQA